MQVSMSVFAISEVLLTHLRRRLERKQGRRDFMTHMISKVESGEMGREELTAHASTLA